MPGPLQVTDVPSPMFQTMDFTFAVAVTVTPPAVAVAEFGPYVVGDWSTAIHTGIPTRPLPPGFGLIVDVRADELHLVDRQLGHDLRVDSVCPWRVGSPEAANRWLGVGPAQTGAHVDSAVSWLATFPIWVTRRRLGLHPHSFADRLTWLHSASSSPARCLLPRHRDGLLGLLAKWP